MVWGLFPVDPLPGEESYFFFSKGTYKVGRKGCDIIVNKDKGVSRVHAEIVIDEMISKENTKKKSSEIRIRDCSKYGTFIKKPLGSKEKVHEFPNKETTLDDADLVSFGTGNATYRFNFVPLVFFICGLEPGQSKELKEKIQSIGASMVSKWSPKCTHVVLDDNVSLNADVADAIMSKKHFVSCRWIEFLADKRIGTDIADCSSYAPIVKLQGVPVKVVEPESRENCLSGYTFLLESSDKYIAKKKLQLLLEAFGGKIIPVEEFILHSQGPEDEDDDNSFVHVVSADGSECSHDLSSYIAKKKLQLLLEAFGGKIIPVEEFILHSQGPEDEDDDNSFVHVVSADGSECSHDLSSVRKVSETNLISSVLSGRLDPAVFVLPPVVVTSTCSTDETVVADSEPEVEITSVHTVGVGKIESVEDEKEIVSVHSVESVTEVESGSTKVKIDTVTVKDDVSVESKDGQRDDGMLTRERKTGDDADSEMGTSDVIFSQDLIIRNADLVTPPASNQVLNFKRFRKMATESGNGFYNLVPFSKHPYKGSEYENDDVAESLREEKKRKQREAVAEDLFNNAKAKQRGAAGFLSGLFKGK